MDNNKNYENNESAEIEVETPRHVGAKIKVIGVGGGGCNAINRMIISKIGSCEFVAINTDYQALLSSHADTRLQIGKDITRGHGAGSDPSIGRKAAEETADIIKDLLKDVDLLFLTAGMGGGTGTGAAPVVARIAKELGILTVAVVTKPFSFEGNKRKNNAEEGIEELRKYVDTLLIIPNQKLLEVLDNKTTAVEAFAEADAILKRGVQSISDLIVKPTLINLDFADVSNIMRNSGLAHIGFGEAKSSDKVMEALTDATNSPMLETSIEGATGIIVCVTAGLTIPIHKIDEAVKSLESVLDANCNIIFGLGLDQDFGEKVSISVIATGFTQQKRMLNSEHNKVDKAVTFDNKEQKDNYNFDFQPKVENKVENMNRINEQKQAFVESTNIKQEPIIDNRVYNKFNETVIEDDRFVSKANDISENDLPPFLRHLRNKKK